MTALAALVVLIGVVALVVIKVSPLYIENMKVKSVMDGVVDQYQNEEMSISEARNGIRSRFTIEDIDAIGPDDIEIELTSSGLFLSVEYEVRTSLFKNIDLVVMFEEQSGEE